MERQTILALMTTLLVLLPTSTAIAVGSGGLLNLVPQAEVWIEENGQRQLADHYSVYVHPMEGSLVLLDNKSNSVLALDKNKKHGIRMERTDVSLNEDATILDVPEDTPYEVLPHSPHFNRIVAKLRLDSERVLLITVER